MALKYVMFDKCMPVVFGEYFTHAEVAQRLRRLAAESFQSPTSEGQITGAGFVSGDGEEWVAYGRSESLNLDPGENDSKILTRVLNRR